MSTSLESKLTAGLRQVKGESSSAAPAPPTASAPSSIGSEHDQQSPAPTVYQPWQNVHPARVWPD